MQPGISGTFAEKVVVITGGALGIGRATAIEFGREGANVTIADVNESAGRSAVAEVEAAGGQALLVVGDVSRATECQRVIAETVGRFGGVDVLFNNVGIQPQESYVPLHEVPE